MYANTRCTIKWHQIGNMWHDTKRLTVRGEGLTEGEVSDWIILLTRLFLSCCIDWQQETRAGGRGMGRDKRGYWSWGQPITHVISIIMANTTTKCFWIFFIQISWFLVASAWICVIGGSRVKKFVYDPSSQNQSCAFICSVCFIFNIFWCLQERNALRWVAH